MQSRKNTGTITELLFTHSFIFFSTVKEKAQIKKKIPLRTPVKRAKKKKVNEIKEK